MNNKILALKYRPRFFNEVIGQDFCVQSLSNSIKLNKMHNAYLFSGTRGVGKTTIARIFAKSLLCKEGISDTPCGKCESCLGIDSNNNLDLIEIDAASRTKVEDTRTLMENVQYAPTSSRFKIYLIDEVHMLSTKSFNALLKTIEEPPEHVKFLLATTDPEKLPETVISRCLHFKLDSITKDKLSEFIGVTLDRESIEYEQNVPLIISEAARGSVRDSMSILEQCISYGNGNLKYSEISQLLGIVDEKLVDDILLNLINNSMSNIHALLDDNVSNNYYKLLDSLIERVFQISISRKSDLKSYDLPDELLVDTLNLEDLQLWYSILLQAKEDFGSASSKKDHLLMILLRINLFTNYPSNQDIETKKISNENSEKNENNIVKKKVAEDNVSETDTVDYSLDSLKKFISSQDIQGLMLDLSYNSIIESNNKCTKLIIDESKQNTYPKKCIDDFISLIIDYFKVTNDLIIEYSNDIFTLYKRSVNEKLKSQDDMYNSIKDNTLIKEIEDVFDAKIDKENISKL